MNTLLKKSVSLLNQNFRHTIYRKLAGVSRFALNSEIEIKMASSPSELDQAFILLYEKSNGIKRVDPQTSGLRAEFFSMLPNTTTVIAKIGSQVVAALSLVRDSGLGLPSDLFYPEQNDTGRKNKKTLVEILALSIADEFSSRQDDLTLLLVKFSINYCAAHSADPQIVMVTSPSQRDYFSALFNFQKEGPTIRYGAWLGKPSIYLTKDLSEAAQKTWKASGLADGAKKNILQFIFQDDVRFSYPESKSGQLIHPVMTPELLNHFQVSNKNVWMRMKKSDKASLLDIYSTFFGKDVSTLRGENDEPRNHNKEYRAPIQLPVQLNIQQEICFGEMKDLSPGGCFVHIAGELPATGRRIELSFELNSVSYALHAEVAWTNGSTKNSKNRGLGLRFLKKQNTIRQDLQTWLYGKNNGLGYCGAKSDFTSTANQVKALIHFSTMAKW